MSNNPTKYTPPCDSGTLLWMEMCLQSKKSELQCCRELSCSNKNNWLIENGYTPCSDDYMYPVPQWGGINYTDKVVYRKQYKKSNEKYDISNKQYNTYKKKDMSQSSKKSNLLIHNYSKLSEYNKYSKTNSDLIYLNNKIENRTLNNLNAINNYNYNKHIIGIF